MCLATPGTLAHAPVWAVSHILLGAIIFCSHMLSSVSTQSIKQQTRHSNFLCWWKGRKGAMSRGQQPVNCDVAFVSHSLRCMNIKLNKNNNKSTIMEVLQRFCTYVCVFTLLRPYLQGSVEGANSCCVSSHCSKSRRLATIQTALCVNWRQKAQTRFMTLIS